MCFIWNFSDSEGHPREERSQDTQTEHPLDDDAKNDDDVDEENAQSSDLKNDPDVTDSDESRFAMPSTPLTATSIRRKRKRGTVTRLPMQQQTEHAQNSSDSSQLVSTSLFDSEAIASEIITAAKSAFTEKLVSRMLIFISIECFTPLPPNTYAFKQCAFYTFCFTQTLRV